MLYGDYPPKLAGVGDGGADFLAGLAHNLASANVSVTAIVSRRLGRESPYRTERGVKVSPLIEDWSLRGAMGGQLSKLRSSLGEEDVDIVHLIYPDPYIRYGSDTYHLPFVLKLAGARRLVVTFFGFGLTGASWPTKIGLLALLATADSIVITDPDLFARFSKAFPIWRRKSRLGLVGALATDPSDTWTNAGLQRRRESIGLDPRTNYVGFFGFWTPDKGLEDLLQAMRLVIDSGLRVKLLLIGGREREQRTQYERTILARVQSLALLDDVVDTGALPANDVIRYLLALDLCVLPFKVNPLGRSSLALAVSLGLPTLVSKPSANANLIEGLPQIPCGDATGLAEAIRQMMSDLSSRDEAAGAARRVSANWNWHSIANFYRAIYEELCD